MTVFISSVNVVKISIDGTYLQVQFGSPGNGWPQAIFLLRQKKQGIWMVFLSKTASCLASDNLKLDGYLDLGWGDRLCDLACFFTFGESDCEPKWLEWVSPLVEYSLLLLQAVGRDAPLTSSRSCTGLSGDGGDGAGGSTSCCTKLEVNVVGWGESAIWVERVDNCFVWVIAMEDSRLHSQKVCRACCDGTIIRACCCSKSLRAGNGVAGGSTCRLAVLPVGMLWCQRCSYNDLRSSNCLSPIHKTIYSHVECYLTP